ncbi:MAG: hypothetical protein C0610_08770, partial [Desulfobacteraceae bacterium]
NAFANHGDTESTEETIFFARSGDPPASPERLAMAGRRRSGKPGTRPKGWTPSEARRKEISPQRTI